MNDYNFLPSITVHYDKNNGTIGDQFKKLGIIDYQGHFDLGVLANYI